MATKATNETKMLKTNGRFGIPKPPDPRMYRKLYKKGPTTLSKAIKEDRSPANSPWGKPDLVPAETRAAIIPIVCAAPRKPIKIPTTAPLYPKNAAPAVETILDKIANVVNCLIPIL